MADGCGRWPERLRVIVRHRWQSSATVRILPPLALTLPPPRAYPRDVLTRNKSLALAFLALTAVAGATAAQGLLIKFQPKVGDVREYKLDGSVEAMGTTVEITGTSTEKTLKVDGDTYVEEISQAMKINMGGSEQEQNSTITSTSKLGGYIVATEGEGANPRTDNLAQFIEPTKEIKIGDTWSYEAKADAKKETPAYKIDYKYLGDEKIGEWDCAKFSMMAKETEGEKPMVFDTTMWLSKADFSRVKMESKFQNMYNPMVPVTLDGKLNSLRTK